jgi:hypothetical protein
VGKQLALHDYTCALHVSSPVLEGELVTEMQPGILFLDFFKDSPPCLQTLG